MCRVLNTFVRTIELSMCYCRNCDVARGIRAIDTWRNPSELLLVQDDLQLSFRARCKRMEAATH